MKTNTTDLATAAQEFFVAYDAHDVEGMIALCADGARGRYAPYGRDSVVPIRGGIDVIWRAFPQAVPNFRVRAPFCRRGCARTVTHTRSDSSEEVPRRSRSEDRRSACGRRHYSGTGMPLPVRGELGLTNRYSTIEGDHCNDDDQRKQHYRTHTIH